MAAVAAAEAATEAATTTASSQAMEKKAVTVAVPEQAKLLPVLLIGLKITVVGV